MNKESVPKNWFLINLPLGKQPPPEFKEPLCYNSPCLKRIIEVKVYIDDTLWNMMSNDGLDPTNTIVKQMEEIFEGINEHLSNLDNGGYMIKFYKKVWKLENSDISLKERYIDRTDGNVKKVLNMEEIWAVALAFQESVGLLRDRNAVDLRILMSHKSQKDPSKTLGVAEENCLCTPETFPCIAIFSFEDLQKWGYRKERRQKQPKSWEIYFWDG